MAFRRDLIALLTIQPRSVSSLARELGLGRGDVDEAQVRIERLDRPG